MYKIMAGDYVVHKTGSIDKSFLALDVKLEQQLNRSGMLTFTLPPTNYALQNGVLQKLKTPIVVYRDDVEIWRGRILDVTQDFNNRYSYKCEGWLSVLCDSIVRPKDNIDYIVTPFDVKKEVTKLIENHNSQVDTFKQLKVAFVGFPDNPNSSSDSSVVVNPGGNRKSINELAVEVIQGLWGDGDERIERLTAAGYDYNAVQAEVNRLLSVEDDVTGAAVDPTEIVTVDDVIDIAVGWLGCNDTDGTHEPIIDVYNSYSPLPRGYQMSYSDPWCDAFLSAVFIQAGVVDSYLGGPECYVDSHIAIFERKGIWKGLEDYVPKKGDIITFDWDGVGETDHIGLIVRVEGTTITTIEGNSGGAVAYQTYEYGSSVIRGYASPVYEKRGSVEDPDDEEITRQFYNTLDYLQEMFLNDENIKGTLYCEGDTLYYYADGVYRTNETTQTIRFGTNLLNYSNYVDASEICTCIIPVGKDGLLLDGSREGSDASILYGFDTSFWHHVPDWSLITGIDFCIFGVTQRDGVDLEWEYNYDGCRANNIKVGIYKYSYALTGEQSRKEAEDIIAALIIKGATLDLPIFLDIEDESQVGLSTETMSAIISEFRAVVLSAGFEFGIYCARSWYDDVIPDEFKVGTKFWIASIPDEDDGQIHPDLMPEGVDNLVAWQYTFNGVINGAPNNTFDLDLYFSSGGGSQGDGSADWIENETGVSMFGKIFKVVEFDNANDVSTLRALAQRKLDKAIIEATTIDISAFDLSMIGEGVTAFKLGDRTRIISKPHGIDDYYICSRVELDLCNPANDRYQFGVPSSTLTSNYNALYNSVATGGLWNASYLIPATSDSERRNISYTIVSKRVEFNSILFYEYGGVVYLSFSAVFKKRVDNTSAFMQFSKKYAPETFSVGMAFDETGDTNFTIKATADGQVIVNSASSVPANHTVSATITWQKKGA